MSPTSAVPLLASSKEAIISVNNCLGGALLYILLFNKASCKWHVCTYWSALIEDMASLSGGDSLRRSRRKVSQKTRNSDAA